MKCNRLVGTTIFASSKTKSRFYLVIYKNTCTFAAVFVFVRFYIRSDARMVIVKVHNTIGISSDAHSFFFSITERNNEKFEIFHQNVWNIQKYSLYLPRQKVAFGYPGRIPRGASLYRHYPIFQCQRCFLTIRAESREGKTISTLPKKG